MPPRQRRFTASAGVPKGPIRHAAAIRDLIPAGRESSSFEYMPPKTAADEQQLWRAIRQLEPLRPTFVSVTYGAGGLTRDRPGPVTGRMHAGNTVNTLGDLRGGRLAQGPHGPGDGPDRRGNHADPDGAPDRGESLGGRAQAGGRL